jgi:hypothetical protein
VPAEVAAGALADAGLTLADVDGFFRAGDAPGFGPLSMAGYLGLTRLRYLDSTETGGPSPGAHVGPAAAIAAGQCRVALITLTGCPARGRGARHRRVARHPAGRRAAADDQHRRGGSGNPGAAGLPVEVTFPGAGEGSALPRFRPLPG